jgi:hypothetical protein
MKLFTFGLIFLLFGNISFASDEKIELKDIGIFNAKVPEKNFSDDLVDARIHKLEHHKKMGHITMGLMVASFVSAVLGKHQIDDERSKRGGIKSGDDAGKMNLHMGIAALTTASYFTTAYFSLSAPKSDEMEDEPARKWHKGLAWVHGTAMVLAPILGYLAFKDYHDGEDPSGLAKLHRPIMMVGFAAFAASYSIAVYEW